MVGFSLHNRSLKFLPKKLFLSHLALKLIKIQMLIVEYVANLFLLIRCQKKRYEQDYAILKDFLSK